MQHHSNSLTIFSFIKEWNKCLSIKWYERSKTEVHAFIIAAINDLSVTSVFLLSCKYIYFLNRTALLYIAINGKKKGYRVLQSYSQTAWDRKRNFVQSPQCCSWKTSHHNTPFNLLAQLRCEFSYLTFQQQNHSLTKKHCPHHSFKNPPQKKYLGGHRVERKRKGLNMKRGENEQTQQVYYQDRVLKRC